MPIDFAWPFAHDLNGVYPAPAGNFAPGRRFRQAVLDPAATDVIDGVEIWMRLAANLHKVFACFTGYLRFVYTPVDTPVGPIVTPALRLELPPNAKLGWPNQAGFRAMDAPWQAIQYVNVGEPSIRTLLAKLIVDNYNAGTSHPALEGWKNAEKIDPRTGRPVFINMRQQLDDIVRNGLVVQTYVDRVIDTFMAMSSSPTPTPYLFPVRAGDLIGEAATFTQLTAPAALGPTPRHLLLKVEEMGGRTRNPMYDVWSWINASRVTNPPITLLQPTNADNHPLLKVQATATDEAALRSLNPPKPPARIKTVGTQRPYAMASLKEWGTHLPPGDPRFTPKLEWRLTDVGRFESRPAPGSTVPNPPMTPTAQQISGVANMWNAHRQHIVDISAAFQVPAELLLPSLCTESGNAPSNVGAARFEGIDEAQRAKLDAGVTNPAYSNLLGLYRQAIPSNGVGGLRVPIPWNPTVAVVTGQAMTWGDVAQLIDISPYFRTRITFGLMQASIATCIDGVAWAKSAFANDLRRLDPTAYNPALEWWQALGLAKKEPTVLSEYMSDWILNPRHAITVGAAGMRIRHNERPLSTAWAPPHVGAAEQAGQLLPPLPADAAANKWGFRSSVYFETLWGPFYKAGIDFLNSLPAADQPPVRLRR